MAVQYEGRPFSRHARSAVWSVKLLFRHRPRKLFLQYSFLLLVIVTLYKTLAPYKVSIYCDCHTKALRRKLHGRGAKLFFYLKKWSIGATDVVILSNNGQVKDLEEFSDRFLIVPDFIPAFGEDNNPEQAPPYCVMSMSFDKDEPVADLADAAELIAKYQNVYITGSAPNWCQQRFSENPRVHVTGFIEDSKYLNLLRYANCIISLTNEEGCLQCAGYEALAFEVPFVTSDTTALRKYFGDSAIFVTHNPASIAKGVEAGYQRHESYRRSMAELKINKERLQQDNVRLLRGLLT
jgi:glycosyltransferase involved in cell wall biosynthesis